MSTTKEPSRNYATKTEGGDETLARLDDARAKKDEIGPDEILLLAQAAASLADDKKAENPVILNVGKQTSYADYFVISSAPSERQVMAIASSIEDTFRKAGIKPLGSEGKSDGNWVLLDFGDFVVHTFLTGARGYYDLEGFWSDVERIPFDDSVGAPKAKELEQEGARRAAERNAG